MRATAAALLVVLGLAACGDGEKSGARLSDQQLARLVLLARDAGPRYQQFADGRTARIELNSALDDDATRFGRQDGWTSRYRNRGRRGALTVASTVDVFSKASGARDFFAAAAKSPPGADLQTTEVPKLGDESRGLVTATSAPGSFRSVTLLWRDGRIVGAITATGLVPQPTTSDVVDLARRPERRINAAS